MCGGGSGGKKIGAFIIFDIKFESKKDREKFEKKYGFTGVNKRYILVDEKANSYGFVAWTFLRDPVLNPIYYMGFMGYDDIVEIYKKWKHKIKKFRWIAINDYGAGWKVLKK